jgi:uncharacterized protein (TIGR03437 family)
VLYYVSPTQIAAVLPSSSPTGTGMLVVYCDEQVSAPVPIRIVPSVFGFDYWSGAMAVATDNVTGKLITTSNSAEPGETLTFWGSGVGANMKNTDVGPPTNFDNLSGVKSFYIGGQSVQIVYQGRSGYQGVDQIDVTLPANVPTGCAVSVAAVSGVGNSTIVSNFVALPIATNGGFCEDLLTWIPTAEIPVLEQKPYLTFGQVSIGQTTTLNASGVATATVGQASASFETVYGPNFAGYQSVYLPTLGSCMVTQSASATPSGPGFLGWLQAGDISVQGPNGTRPVPVTTPGFYAANPLSGGFIPASGGTFMFTGTVGQDVGAFSVAAVIPPPVTWSNSASLGSIDRAQPLTLNWHCCNGTDIVQITGMSALAGGGFSAGFVCDSLDNGSFTVPVAVLQALPVGAGTLSVSSYMPPPQPFTATWLDLGFAVSYSKTQINATYF